MKSLIPLVASLPVLCLLACGGSAPAPAASAADPAPTDPPPPLVTIMPPPQGPGAEDPAQDPGESAPPVANWTPAMDVPEAWLHPEAANDIAPEEFTVTFRTTKGPFVVRVHRRWAPQGADRFYNLVRIGYFSDIAFFRVIDGFMVQFGIHGEPRVNAAWRNARIPDDPNRETNRIGTMTFATSGPGSRTVQLFINTVDNARLDGMGFAPFGEVIQGLEVVRAVYSGYGEGAPMGRGPGQAELQQQGNDYLRREFPDLDYIQAAWLGM